MLERQRVMSGADIMSKKKKKEPQTTWSIDMLEAFRNGLVYRTVPWICFIIKEG
jgi:hypothetical protein